MSKLKWTFEACLEEALRYPNYSEFSKNSKSCYLTCIKRKWLNIIQEKLVRNTKPKNYWTFDRCQEEARKYEYRSEFRAHSNTAYAKAWKNGWLENICNHMAFLQLPKNYWTKERCVIEALKYSTRTDFARGNGNAYSRSIANGWLDDICSHMKINGNLHKRFIYAYEFPDNHVYVGLTCNIEDRQRAHSESGSVFDYCFESGLVPIFKRLIDEPVDPEEASRLENKYLEDYIRNGWIKLNRQKPGGLGNYKNKWDYESCKEEALKYQRRTDFKENCTPAYRTTLKRGWSEELFSHMSPSNTVHKRKPKI